MPWIMPSSSLSSPLTGGAISRLANTSPDPRNSTSPSQRSYRTLDSSSWRKQVCEVRPNRSSTLGRFPAARQSSDVSDDKTTASRPDAVASPSATATDEPLQRPRVPRPPARSSSDCCRCQWLRAASTTATGGRASTVSPSTHPGRRRDRSTVLGGAELADGSEGRTAYGVSGLRPPPPPPPLLTSPTAISVTSPTAQDVCVHVEKVDSCGTAPVHGGCLVHAGGAHPRTPDLGICSESVDGSSRYCLEDIREVDETAAVEQSNTPKLLKDHPSVSVADPRRQATSCTITTFV